MDQVRAQKEAAQKWIRRQRKRMEVLLLSAVRSSCLGWRSSCHHRDDGVDGSGNLSWWPRGHQMASARSEVLVAFMLVRQHVSPHALLIAGRALGGFASGSRESWNTSDRSWTDRERIAVETHKASRRFPCRLSVDPESRFDRTLNGVALECCCTPAHLTTGLPFGTKLQTKPLGLHRRKSRAWKKRGSSDSGGCWRPRKRRHSLSPLYLRRDNELSLDWQGSASANILASAASQKSEGDGC